MGVRLGACRRERASGRGMEASRRARVFDGALAACAADVVWYLGVKIAVL